MLGNNHISAEAKADQKPPMYAHCWIEPFQMMWSQSVWESSIFGLDSHEVGHVMQLLDDA